MALYLGKEKINKVGVTFVNPDTSQAGELATPSINTSTGVVTASISKAGYISTSTSKTLNLPTQTATTITPSNTTQTVVEANKYTLGTVKVSAVPEETKTITANGIYIPSSGKWFSSISVNVPTDSGETFETQSKTVSPSTSQQIVTPDAGYDGLSQVTVNAMPTTAQATPSISVNSSGLITASSVQTAGYVSAGTKSATQQLNTQAAKIITPSTTSQTAVDSDVYTTGVVTVAGDSNLVSGNIKSGVSIFGIEGTLSTSGGSSEETEFQVYEIEVTPSSNSLTIQFTGLVGEPSIYSITPTSGITLATTRYITGIEYDGTMLRTSYSYKQSSYGNSYTNYDTSSVSQSYTDGTLTLTSASASSTGYFRSGIAYRLMYGITAVVSGEETPINLQDKIVSITSNGTQTITADSGYDGLGSVEVTVDIESNGSGGITPSGTIQITSNGTYDVTNYASASVNIPTGGGSLPDTIVAGDTPVLYNSASYQATKTSLTSSGISLTVPKDGTYRFKWMISGGSGDSAYPVKTRLYKNGTAVGTQKSTATTLSCSEDITCVAGDTVTVYLAGYSFWSEMYGGCGGLCACIDWDNGF